MFAVVLFAMIFTAALALLLARYATDPAVARADERDRVIADRRPRIAPSALRAIVMDLLDRLGLDVIEEEVRGFDRRLVARQRSPESAPIESARYVVFVVPQPPGDLVGQAEVVDLAENVKAERASTGILITPYAIEVAGLAGLDVPVEVVDGPRLRELIATYLPARLAELDGYRGFAPPTVARPAQPQPV